MFTIGGELRELIVLSQRRKLTALEECTVVGGVILNEVIGDRIRLVQIEPAVEADAEDEW